MTVFTFAFVQISEGDMLASINGTLVPQYGYDLNVIRDMLAGVRGSRVTLGFKSKFGQEYEVSVSFFVALYS
jgi:hypothetical protein